MKKVMPRPARIGTILPFILNIRHCRRTKVEKAEPERIGRFNILRRLGAGGMGVVYLAEDPMLGRAVALKVLSERMAGDQERLLRFQREAWALSNVNHPNIVTIYEIGDAGGSPFIASEYIEGVTLRQLLDRRLLGLPRIVEISIEVAEALAAAHEAGIVHGDIKPGNIMIGDDGCVKVLDFGLAEAAPARVAGSGDGSAADTVVMGTVRYTSPERANGLVTDARSDIFSLGTMMYEMVADRVPFQGGTVNDALLALRTTDPPALNPYASNTHPELQRILNRCLAKNPEDRYSSARECASDLLAFGERLRDLRKEKDSSQEMTTGAPPTGAHRRHRWRGRSGCHRSRT